jgi:hypothetical protein
MIYKTLHQIMMDAFFNSGKKDAENLIGFSKWMKKELKNNGFKNCKKDKNK